MDKWRHLEERRPLKMDLQWKKATPCTTTVGVKRSNTVVCLEQDSEFLLSTKDFPPPGNEQWNRQELKVDYLRSCLLTTVYPF